MAGMEPAGTGRVITEITGMAEAELVFPSVEAAQEFNSISSRIRSCSIEKKAPWETKVLFV
jgi:hypothetical protein